MSSARTVELVDGYGGRHILACSDEPYQLGPGANIWGGSDFEFASSTVAGIPGERFDDYQVGATVLAVPVVIVGTEYQQDDRLGELARFCRPDRDVKLIYTRPSGVRREIVARCINAGARTQIDTWADPSVKPLLTLKAFDPYWRTTDAEIESARFTFADGFFAQANAVEVTNAGDVDTWPRITVNGPCQNFQIASLETGEVFRLQRVIDDGTTVRIETDPRHRNVWVNDGLDWRAVDPGLNETPKLRPGLNRFVVRALSSPAPGPIGTFGIEWTPLYSTC